MYSIHIQKKGTRSHAVRHIKDIRVADLEDPRTRNNCVRVMHQQTTKMQNKVRALQKQNKRLKKVKNLTGALQKFEKENLVSSDKCDELLVSS